MYEPKIVESIMVIGLNSDTLFKNKNGQSLHCILLDFDDSPLEEIEREIKQKQDLGFIDNNGKVFFLGSCHILISSETVEKSEEEDYEIPIIKRHGIFFSNWFTYPEAVNIVKSFGCVDREFKKWRDKRESMCMRISMKDSFIPRVEKIMPSANRQENIKVYKNGKEFDLWEMQEQFKKMYFKILQLEQNTQMKPFKAFLIENKRDKI